MRYKTLFLINAQEKYNSIVKEQRLRIPNDIENVVNSFSRHVDNPSDYKVCADIASRIFENANVDAIIYPSIQTDGDSTCIAIKPKSVDEGKIKLSNVIVSKIVSNGTDMEIKNIKRGQCEENTLTIPLVDIIQS